MFKYSAKEINKIAYETNLIISNVLFVNYQTEDVSNHPMGLWKTKK